MTIKKKTKPGPAPLGLAPAFSLRLTEEQDKQVRAAARRYKITKAEAVRRALPWT